MKAKPPHACTKNKTHPAALAKGWVKGNMDTLHKGTRKDYSSFSSSSSSKSSSSSSSGSSTSSEISSKSSTSFTVVCASPV
ncbi:MAG: hypothetical protein E7363_03675 [Clostridiales bacterium]|nr:hypothetical protein [Clostridiales bacterium]